MDCVRLAQDGDRWKPSSSERDVTAWSVFMYLRLGNSGGRDLVNIVVMFPFL